MLLDILNKAFIVLFILSVLNTLRHTYYFIQTWFYSTQEEPMKYKVSDVSLFLLGMSISYVFECLFFGIKI
jgi:hypothetical protein